MLDVLRQESGGSHRKKEETLNLAYEDACMKGTLRPGNGWQEVRLPRQARGRYFCLEGLSAQDGGNVAAIAEMEVLGPGGKPLSREHWKIRYADSEESLGGNHTADKIFDLQESTYWRSGIKTAYPHQLVIDLGEECSVTGFRYLPRAEKGAPGMVKDFRVYVKKSDFLYR